MVPRTLFFNCTLAGFMRQVVPADMSTAADGHHPLLPADELPLQDLPAIQAAVQPQRPLKRLPFVGMAHSLGLPSM